MQLLHADFCFWNSQVLGALQNKLEPSQNNARFY